MSTTGFIPRTQRTAPLIGLGGKLRAGKDEVADYLAREHGYHKLGMSDALNDALLKLNPWIPSGQTPVDLATLQLTRYRDLHDALGYVEAKKNPEVRRLLQVLGTEIGRDMIDPNVWVDIAEKRIKALLDAGTPVVITAIRFPNELEMVRRLGGTSVWIDRSDSKRLESTDRGRTPDEALKSLSEARGASERHITEHASETSVSLEQFDSFISNEGSLEELYARVEEVSQ